MLRSHFSLIAALCVATSVPAAAQQELARLHGAAAGDRFGYSLAFVGDVDADGHADFAIASPGANGVGALTVYSGRTQAVLHTWHGGGAGDFYGGAVCGAGDVDGDGHADVLVGAPRGVKYLVSQVGGYVELRSGATGAVLRQVVGPAAPRGFGAALAAGADFDGDGVADWLIGAPGGPGSKGAAYVYSGASGALLRTHVPPPATTPGLPGLGYDVAILGDIDGDGVADYVLGAPVILTPGFSYVQTFSGATGESLWRTVQPTDVLDEEFGYSLAALSDISGDGLPDLVVGARQGAAFGPTRGRVYLLSGADGAVLTSYAQGVGAINSVCLGSAVAELGDLDGDGRPEFAGGAPGHQPEIQFTSSAPTRIWSSTAQAALLTLPLPASPLNGFGHTLASGDASGDGLRDLLVGEPYADVNGTSSGTVYVYTFVRAPTRYCWSQSNSQGCQPAIASSGTPSASSSASFSISASELINNTSGLLFYGLSPSATPFNGTLLCVGQPRRRTAVQSTGGSGGGTDCSGSLAFDFNAFVQSGADPSLTAGVEVFSQWWSRDAQAPSTSNLTDALAFYLRP